MITELFTCQYVMMCALFCFFHQLQIMLEHAVAVLDAWLWDDSENSGAGSDAMTIDESEKPWILEWLESDFKHAQS